MVRNAKKTESRTKGKAENMAREIERKAFELYQKRGAKPGNELGDWLEAEKMVKQQARR